MQCEETATRTRDLPVTGGKTLPLAPGPPFKKFTQNQKNTEVTLTVNAEVFVLTRLWNTKAKANSYLHQIILEVNISLEIKGRIYIKTESM